MLSVVVNFEDNGDLWIERLNTDRSKISVNVEHKTVNAGGQRLVHQKERLDPTILVSPCVTEFSPTLVSVLRLQANRYAFCRRAARGVKDVG